MPIGEISTSSNGEDVDFEWRIDAFFSLSGKDNFGYSSPDFSFGGEKWCLIIWLKDCSGRNSSGHVDLRLWKYSPHSSIRQEFSLSIKTLKGEKYHEKHCTRAFDVGNCGHDFNRFIQRSELLRRRPELMPHDVLTVVCTMKNMTSAGSATFFQETFTLETGSETATVLRYPIQSNSSSAACSHCKEAFDAVSLSSHQRKCMHRPIKCPDCLEVVVLQKLLDEHECQKKRPQEVKRYKENCENACVDATTQTEKQDDAGSLCEDYKKVLLGGCNHDLILKIGDKELHAHKDILRARSRVFESMLDHDMKEKKSGIIDVPDCDPDAMELFLSYVYCGKIEALDHSNMLGLYYVADKYEMMDLKRECCNFIKKSLYLTNVCNVIQLALNHSDSDLLEHATGYFSDNLLAIIQTVEWQSFLKDNSTVANELLVKSIKKLKNV